MNEYEPAGKVVFVAGLIGPPGMLPDAPPPVLPPLLLIHILVSLTTLSISGKGRFLTKNSYGDSSTRKQAQQPTPLCTTQQLYREQVTSSTPLVLQYAYYSTRPASPQPVSRHSVPLPLHRARKGCTQADDYDCVSAAHPGRSIYVRDDSILEGGSEGQSVDLRGEHCYLLILRGVWRQRRRSGSARCWMLSAW